MVANHPTLIDYVILASVMPETDCLVKSALLRNPFVSGVIRSADYLINSEAEPPLVWFNLLLIVQRDRAAVAAWRVAALRPASASS